jgi:hypothetical protein
VPEIYFEVPPAAFISALPPIGRSVAGTPLKLVSLAALVAGELAYSAIPPSDDWQKWANKAMRHGLWHEMHKRRRRHYPNAYTDTGNPPIH